MGKHRGGIHVLALAACGLIFGFGCGEEEQIMPGQDAQAAETRDGVTGEARDGDVMSDTGSPGDAPAMPADAVDAPVDQLAGDLLGSFDGMDVGPAQATQRSAAAR